MGDTVDGVNVKISGDSSELKEALMSAAEAAGGFGGALESLKAIMLGPAGVVVAIGAVVEISSKLIDAFAEEETAALKFNAAVKNSKYYTEGMSAELQVFSAEFRKLSGVTDEAANQMMAFLLSTGRSTQQVENMMTAAQGLAVATGQDLNTALQQLDMTFSGNIGRLGRLHPELKDLTKEELENGVAVDVMLEKYGAFASALAGSTKVSMDNFKNALNETKSAFGETLANDLMPFRDALTAVFEWFVNHKEVIQGIFKTIEVSLAISSGGATALLGLIAKITGEAHNANQEFAGFSKQLQAAKDSAQRWIDEKAAADAKALSEKTAADKKSAAEEAAWQALLLKGKLEADQEFSANEIDIQGRRLAGEYQAYVNFLTRTSTIDKSNTKANTELSNKDLQEYVDAQEAKRKASEDAAKKTATAWGNAFTFMAQASAPVFDALGTALVKQGDSWKDVGKAGIQAIGGIVKALGDQLSAMAAAKLVEAIADALDPFTAWAAPGEFAAAAVEATGAAAAWVAAGAITASASSFAAGTPYAPGGLATVGEEGPERVILPKGSQVMTAAQTANAGRAGGITVQINSPRQLNASENARAVKKTMHELAFRGVL